MNFESQMQYILDTIGFNDTKPQTSAWTQKDVSPVTPVNDPNSNDPYQRYKGDVYALTNEYGPLQRGMTINITLRRMLELAPRHRPRIESYMGLITYLREDIGTELVITSAKTKPKEENGGQ